MAEKIAFVSLGYFLLLHPRNRENQECHEKINQNVDAIIHRKDGQTYAIKTPDFCLFGTKRCILYESVYQITVYADSVTRQYESSRNESDCFFCC